MKAGLLIAAAAMLPTHAALAQDPASGTSGRDGASASGARVELMAGSDNDGFENGVLYGGRVGYDFQAGKRFLLGVDAEYSEVSTDQEFDFPGLPSLRADDGPEYYAGGRATFVLSNRFRLFGAGGYSRTKEGVFFQTSPNPAPLGTIAADRRSMEGFRLSAGGQMLLGRRAFLGAEYRYAVYGDQGLNREQVVASIGFRF